MNDHLTSTEAAEILGVKSLPHVRAVAVREGWERRKVSHVLTFLKADVLAFRDTRLRTKLAKAQGWSGRGLYRADDIDTACPVCAAFAIEWPAPPHLSEKIVCLEGHVAIPGDDAELPSDEFWLEGESPASQCLRCGNSLEETERLDTMGSLVFTKSCHVCNLNWEEDAGVSI